MKQAIKDNPGKSTVAGIAVLVALVGPVATEMFLDRTPKYEGVVLRGYLDPAGIPTKCMGDTHDVIVGKPYTIEECQDSMVRQIVAHARPVLTCAPAIKVNPYVVWASGDYAYNAGPGRFCNDWRNRHGRVIYRAAGPLFQAGKWREGCLALAKPDTAGGQVLRGLQRRRADEVSVCLKGLGQ